MLCEASKSTDRIVGKRVTVVLHFQKIKRVLLPIKWRKNNCLVAINLNTSINGARTCGWSIMLLIGSSRFTCCVTIQF